MRLRVKDIVRILDRLMSSPIEFIRDGLQIWFAARIIRKSDYFDEKWYESDNPSVRNSGVDPVLHYLIAGFKEGSDPSVDFCNSEYCLLNPDVKEGMNPLLHYERVGKKEGRAIHVSKDYQSYTMEGYRLALGRRASRIRKKFEDGVRLKACFLVSQVAMFPARPLFEKIKGDSRFDVSIIVVPELRLRDVQAQMSDCQRILASDYGDAVVRIVGKTSCGTWENLLEQVDFVCYSSPYNLYPFWYNPRYSIEGSFLPIYVNYGIPCVNFSKSGFASQNFAYFWKIFGECAETADLYARSSKLRGSNMEIVGYVKMDSLHNCKRHHSPRKRILIAFHHSVEGGMNQEMSLSNFCRYSDYFKSLPDRYPEIDFIFRPHPFLFRVLRREDQWGEKKVDQYLNTLCEKNNVIFVAGGNYMQLFVDSDACIQDCGSFLAEYVYTKKPCCYMLKSPSDVTDKFVFLGQRCLENCYLSYSTHEIESFIKEVVVGGYDPKAEQRTRFANELMVNYPNAAGVAVDCIIKSLKEAE